MALIVGTNSYINVTDADLYFEDRLHTSAWDAIVSLAEKGAALIQGTKAIEAFNYNGYRNTTTQALSFPRSDVYVDNILIDATIVPQDIKDAVCEYAILMLQEDYTAPDDLEAFSDVQIGSIKISKSQTKGRSIPPAVSALLLKYRNNSVRLVRA